MNIWQIIFCIIVNALWVIPFIIGVVIEPIKDSVSYGRKFKKWNSEHPNLLRKRCFDCKYCKKETLYSGRYPNGYPNRCPVYCRLLKRNLSNSLIQRCQIPDPPLEFVEMDKVVRYPKKDVPVYFSAYGDSYHSTPSCTFLKNSKYIRESALGPCDRHPCSKCWTVENETLYPKK